MYAQKSIWDSETNFFQGGDFFDSLLESINNAQQCIYLETYIFDYDHLGQRFIDCLIQARQRGVEIKVIVDGIGAMDDINTIMDRLESNDIALKIYHPLPWSFRSYQYAITKGGFFEKLLHFTGHINRRDHRKLFIIDFNQAWTGSFNISATHLSKDKQGQDWKDHGIKVSGNQVVHLAEEFLFLWGADEKYNQRRTLPFVLSSLNPLKRQRKIQRITQGIENAKTRIWIANAYFAPHRSVVASLIKAKRKGVDVKILVSGKSDIFFFPNFTRSFYSDLLDAGIEIYEWHHTILHSKVVLIDDYCYSGSSNLNSRSHFHDLELDILVCLENTIREIETQMLSDFSYSPKVRKRYFFRNKVYISIASFIPKLLRYWL